MNHDSSTLEMLLEGLFDYSGMFPPEAKSLEDALADSARFPQTLCRPWLVNTDFVLALGDLRKVTTDILKRSGFSDERHFRCAVLGSLFTGDIAPFFSEVKLLLEFNRTNSENRPSSTISSYEIRLDAAVLPSSSLTDILRPLAEQHIAIFLEPDLSVHHWEEVLASTIECITPLREVIGLKFRGTGPTGIATPKIARVLRAGARAQLHLKATGGMHHPIIESRYGNTLGFLNVAMALALLRSASSSLTEEDLVFCLNETDVSAFSFGSSARWHDHEISLRELREIHARLRFSIGSCSLREPDEDLVRLFGTPSSSL